MNCTWIKLQIINNAVLWIELHWKQQYTLYNSELYFDQNRTQCKTVKPILLHKDTACFVLHCTGLNCTNKGFELHDNKQVVLQSNCARRVACIAQKLNCTKTSGFYCTDIALC